MKTTKKKSFKRLFAFLMAFVMVTALAANAVFAAGSFTDVKEGDDFYENIESLYAQDIIGGFPDGTFRPKDNLTRQQAAKMVALGADYADHDGTGSKLVDVADLTWGQENIWALEADGVVKGFGTSNEFRPRLNITRGHVAKMIAKAFHLEEGEETYKLTDIAGVDNEEYIKILASNGIVSGFKGTTEFRPDELVTRGQFAKMVDLAMQANTFRVLDVRAINGAQVVFEFSKAVKKDTVISGTGLNTTNIKITALDGQTLPAYPTAALSDDGKTVTLSTGGVAVYSGRVKVVIKNVKSADGEKTVEPFDEIVDFGEDTKAPVVIDVEYGLNDATVIFSEPLKVVGTVSLDGAVLANSEYDFTAPSNKLKIKNLIANGTYKLAITGAKDYADNFIDPNPTFVDLTLEKDTVKPTATLSAEDDVITVKFSEKINDTDPGLNAIFTVDGVAQTLTKAALIDDPTGTTYAFKYSLGSLAFKTVTAKVSGYKDLSGNVGDDVTATFTLTPEPVDETAPVLVEATYKDDTITLEFDEKISLASLTEISVKHTDKDNIVKSFDPASVASSVAGTGAKLEKLVTLQVISSGLLDGVKLLPGKWDVTIATGKIKDLAGNTKEYTFSLGVTASVEDPTATVEVVPANTKQVANLPGAITVKFNKDMGQSALVAGNYKLAGVTIPASSELYFDNDLKTVRINLPEGHITVNGARELSVANVLDKDGNTLKVGMNVATIDLLENVRPTVTKVELIDSKTLKVAFSEAMASTSVAGATGVTVKINGTAVPAANITLAYDSTDTAGKTITATGGATVTFKLTDTITVEFASASIADLVGNLVNDVVLVAQ